MDECIAIVCYTTGLGLGYGSTVCSTSCSCINIEQSSMVEHMCGVRLGPGVPPATLVTRWRRATTSYVGNTARKH